MMADFCGDDYEPSGFRRTDVYLFKRVLSSRGITSAVLVGCYLRQTRLRSITILFICCV